jgi:D-xylose transport system substrate-binding protein
MKSIPTKVFLLGILVLLPFTGLTQRIGLLLDNYVTDRWYLDQKLFCDRVLIDGGECLLEVAYGDADEQYKLAEKLIARKIDVLAIVPTDARKAANIVELAKKNNVPVIAYDRLIYSNDIALYVSYNNERVGYLQAEYMLKRYPKGKYMLLNGPITDNNAVLFRKGQLEALKVAVKSGAVSIIEDHVLTDWSEIGAFEFMKEHLAKAKEIPDVVIAANDALANGVIQALPTTAAGTVGITGQDADLTGVRNIITSNQDMTIYKPIRPLAFLAAEAALELSRGRNLIAAKEISHGNGISVKTILLDPMVVDKSNYKETVIKDGHASLSEVLKNLGSVFEEERSKVQVSLLQKEKALEIEKQVNQRNMFVVITAFFLASVVGLGYTIYHKQKNNRLLNTQKFVIERKNRELHKTNLQLQTVNEELIQQQEEISAQRDAIAIQKEKLQEAKDIMEKQKHEIMTQNEDLEKQVQKRTGELVQYNRQLEQYAFITAHNLRAPVARIIGLGQVLKMQQSDPEESAFIIDKLMVASQELDRVIKELNSILDIRKFSVEVMTEVNLEEQVAYILSNLEGEIKQTQAIINIDFNGAREIFSIKPYIHSILFNLISNAIKYRDPKRQPVITIKSEIKENQLCLTVADNGMGIDLASHQDMMFQLYKRFHFHADGRGIGLFLVKTQIDALEGKIELDSKVNHGTTFRVFLPIHTKPAVNKEKKIDRKSEVSVHSK